jgi:hypothetical protein
MRVIKIVLVLGAVIGSVGQTPPVGHASGSRMSDPVAAFCTVSGKVTTSAGEPLSSANVTLRGTKGTRESYTGMTDGNGSFTIKNVIAGDYLVGAHHDGYAPVSMGRLVNLQPAQVRDDVKLTLRVGASVAGRLTNAHGEPAAAIAVTILMADGEGGVHPLFGQERQTGPAGEFRFDGLDPGTYFLITDSLSFIPAIQEDPLETFVPTFYPGVREFREASPIVVAEGDHVADLAFAMKPVFPRRVRGRIEVPNDAGRHTSYIDVSPSVYEVSLPRSKRVQHGVSFTGSFSVDYSFGPNGIDPAEEKGIRRSLNPGMPRRAPGDSFELWVLPGSYRLVASLVNHGEPEPAGGWRSLLPDAPYLNRSDEGYQAEVALNVADHDVDGVVISFVGLSRLNGVVRFASRWQGAIPGETVVSLQRAADGSSGLPSAVSRDGEFALKYLAPGRYTAKVRVESEDLKVQAVRLDGAEIGVSEIEVKPGMVGKIEVIAINELGQLEGVVKTNAGEAAAGTMVWLSRESQPKEPVRSSHTDSAGHFLIRNVAPGAYQANALFRGDAFSTVQQFKSTPAGGTSVTIPPFGHATANLEISPVGQTR